jgi:hypothetical protein
VDQDPAASVDGVFSCAVGSSWDEDGVVRDVVVQHVLNLGSKSFSHMLNIMERFVFIDFFLFFLVMYSSWPLCVCRGVIQIFKNIT